MYSFACRRSFGRAQGERLRHLKAHMQVWEQQDVEGVLNNASFVAVCENHEKAGMEVETRRGNGPKLSLSLNSSISDQIRRTRNQGSELTESLTSTRGRRAPSILDGFGMSTTENWRTRA